MYSFNRVDTVQPVSFDTIMPQLPTSRYCHQNNNNDIILQAIKSSSVQLFIGHMELRSSLILPLPLYFLSMKNWYVQNAPSAMLMCMTPFHCKDYGSRTKRVGPKRETIMSTWLGMRMGWSLTTPSWQLSCPVCFFQPKTTPTDWLTKCWMGGWKSQAANED